MLASMSMATLLLLASAAVSAQDTPSVVTSISITPTPASEEVFTIQTSEPPSGTWTFDCDCIQEPCSACTTDDVMSIPPGETPISTGDIASTIFTNPLRTSESALSFLPPGETPISTGSLDIPATATLNATRSSSATVSGSGLPEQTTNAAVARNGHGAAFWVGLLGAAAALF
ncbi:hypothetical protein T440DRAFT_486095 [Plenodomus tracheiphilus IPT5]|uniref:GPI anchored protein n=1 Tax=Plenodomus tracheiphilus IPT5 TaxID=1408161 RepID=A0A6A7BKT3_9PLEO|nr:hypothetical protein T440DRAFT_486095 [Plenodomus tracheiphilus IPT5]